MIEYIDVANMPLHEAQLLIEEKKEELNQKTRYDVIAHQMQKEMLRRHASHNKNKKHPTLSLQVHGEIVDIDEDMIPVIKWLNNLPGVFTTFCCQGDVDAENNGDHHKPYVLWYSNDPPTTVYLIKLFTEFHHHSATLNVSHSYHEIKTEVDYFMDGVRYSSKWYDNIALKDFIAWAKI